MFHKHILLQMHSVACLQVIVQMWKYYSENMWESSQWLGKNIVWSIWLIELQESMNRCTACPNITEILLKMVLTYYHTMPHFDALKIYSCGKHCEKRRNCLLQAISPFRNVFFPRWHFIFILNALQNVICSLFQFGPV